MKSAWIRQTVTDFSGFQRATEEMIIPYDYASMTIFRNTSDPGEAIVLISNINPNQVRKFYDSDDYRDKAMEAGVVGEAEIVFVEEVETLSPAQ